LYANTLLNEKLHCLSRVIRERVGVVLTVSPFNALLVLPAKMVVFSLGAGNAVVAKPSEETPLITVELAKVMYEAGLPDGFFNVVTGFGAECGKPSLAKHPQINGISLTGSTGTGVKNGQIAVQSMKRMHLELGEKSAVGVERCDEGVGDRGGGRVHARWAVLVADRIETTSKQSNSCNEIILPTLWFRYTFDYCLRLLNQRCIFEKETNKLNESIKRNQNPRPHPHAQRSLQRDDARRPRR